MMNHLIVDVTEAEVDADTVFTLIGRDGAEEVTADDLAGWAGTINYEIVARLGAHLPRLVVAEGEPLG
jgi:alanine racemase